MAPTPIPLPRHICDALGLSQNEVAFREGSATIVLPTKEAAFLNPVQEFNRDLSVAALRAWGQIRNEEKRKRFEAGLAKRIEKKKAQALRKRQAKSNGDHNDTEAKRRKVEGEGESASAVPVQEGESSGTTENAEGSTTVNGTTPYSEVYRDFKFTVLEALSATGLRSIRYAREVPNIRQVMANDLSTTAVEAMKRNVALNFPAGKPIEKWQPPLLEMEDGKVKKPQKIDEDTIAEIENGISASAKAVESMTESASSSKAEANTTTPAASTSIHQDCNIRINEADAISLMYAHRDDKHKFDVVDLDPYGSAAIFLDGAVQCIADGGLLCVTCTDSAVLAGTSHPEKCFSAYGGVTTKTEYSHEFALRLVLHAIATSAARYGRHIEPLLSLSIDFYVRVFVRVQTRPVEVKRLASKMGAVFTCTGCQSHSALPFGRHHENNETRSGQILDKFQPGAGPTIGSACDQCGSRYHTAGPMWLGQLHDKNFCQEVLSIVRGEPEKFATRARINGMVGTASEELGTEALFFFTPSRLSSFFRCSSPPMLPIVSALLHAGFQVSRSHCQPGSLKTTATRAQIYALWREWIKRNPVKMEGISTTSPAYRLLTRQETEAEASTAIQWNLEEHPGAKDVIDGSESSKGTRYQANPLPNWGPGTAARTTKAAK
ncbi:N2,N2-dimethylguanosine tRNA methyltransferase [Meira miltonrushii]|uniref:tRNA (guanine(26)-N(2))-dimethyltransferase n=1 Tax=Meira miltonrushii TaxID=1280837 RepID=A0A316VBE9_9BASI|nr:N2,N2-dimethylguanosine tRNA methyltransferase [Meira miltonrushii]PWN34820.1 N2,N2-dimethylguanosine tRNA methyltransferase [Meira miltonrushii]